MAGVSGEPPRRSRPPAARGGPPISGGARVLRRGQRTWQVARWGRAAQATSVAATSVTGGRPASGVVHRRGGFRRSSPSHRLRPAAEHPRRVGAEHPVQQAGVDRAEVGGVLEVAVVEVGQAGLRRRGTRRARPRPSRNTGPAVPWSVPSLPLARTRRPNSEYTSTTTCSPAVGALQPALERRPAPRRAGRAAAPGCRARRSGCRSRRGRPSRPGSARPARPGWPPCPAGRRAGRRHRPRRPCPGSRPGRGSVGSAGRPVRGRAEGAGRPLQIGQRGGHPGLPRPVGRVGAPELRPAPAPSAPPGKPQPGQRERRGGHLLAGQQRRQHRLQRHRGQRVGGGGVQPAAEPTGGARRLRRRGLPDGHRAEVAAVGLRVADATDDGQLPVVPQRLQTRSSPGFRPRPSPRSSTSSGR